MSRMLGHSSYNISTYSRFNISESTSDIEVFVGEYRNRILTSLQREEENAKVPFLSYANKRLSLGEFPWLQDNDERFFRGTPNDNLVEDHYSFECGFICSMVYTPDGSGIIVGHSSGLIQVMTMTDPEQQRLVQEYAKNLREYYRNELNPKLWYPMFYHDRPKEIDTEWVKENNEKFLTGTSNKSLQHRWFCSEKGAITSMQFSPNGYHIIVGHASGAIEMRHGSTGIVLCTLRSIQFPPKPVHALEYSPFEPNICYAACMDGAIYRIEIPSVCEI